MTCKKWVIEEEVGDELKRKVLSSIYSNSTLGGQGNLEIKVRKDGANRISLDPNISWESNIGDSDNTGYGGKIAGRAITSWGGGMVSYACMNSIFESSCKGEKTSMSKRYLVKSLKSQEKCFPVRLRNSSEYLWGKKYSQYRNRMG
uniref:Uncharacterized protein n=1 Tax=Tanacetum cinerariifolium TaxID=118510 RepID=A0A699JU87_TANCI|nr:hypothetical protein [Tanacetum cinerariifolium]